MKHSKARSKWSPTGKPVAPSSTPVGRNPEQEPPAKAGARVEGSSAGKRFKGTPIIDADGHVRETDEEIMEYMSAGYRSRRDAMLYFPLVPHHGWHRSIPANDYRHQDFRVPDWKEWAGKLDEAGR